MRILAIGAHPDDIENGCGGTLAKYAQLEHTVFMAYATNGDKGHFRIPPEELAQIREKEARASAAVIGAQVIWAGFPDGDLFYDRPTRERFIDILRQARPDIIFTHNPDDYHPDHCAVSQLVFGASFISTVPHIKTKYPACDNVPPIYYIDAHPIQELHTPLYVDISDTFEIKMEMSQCHQSQISWLKEHDNDDMLERIKTRALAFGSECGVGFAERFMPRNPEGINHPLIRSLMQPTRIQHNE